MNLFKIKSKYEKPNISLLYSIRPTFLIYENNNCDEILFCDKNFIQIGNGPNGHAITIDKDLSIGKSFEGNCFDFHLYNKAENFEIVRMEIYNLV